MAWTNTPQNSPETQSRIRDENQNQISPGDGRHWAQPFARKTTYAPEHSSQPSADQNPIPRIAERVIVFSSDDDGRDDQSKKVVVYYSHFNRDEEGDEEDEEPDEQRERRLEEEKSRAWSEDRMGIGADPWFEDATFIL
ncbi:hypothetical protein QBC46DRAFT_349552 [Diplogelasinospora grovesii]|uniref:Uncharacterized protein n=1 Tax=Diplogelasinospora grovesii TaxID=303347 RepID=A0AAN6S963_9PEZI|nr:hypothetical protein QBC46DRAFT_349552 [Diplogelasinospora grovesii]